jgi:soluble cytochrome b562
MKFRLLHACLAFAFANCLIAGSTLQAQEAPTKKTEETELGKSMEKISGAWRKLRRQVADPASNAASLELVATISAAAEKALTLTPARIEDVPAADREKFAVNYRQGMKEFHAEIVKLAAALQAGDNAAAQELVRKIGDLQKAGHREFKRPD